MTRPDNRYSLSRLATLVRRVAGVLLASALLGGPPAMALDNGTSAEISLTPYVDFNFLLDLSGSMQVAATRADMAKLAPLALAASNFAAANIAPYNTKYNGKNSYMNGAAQGADCANFGAAMASLATILPTAGDGSKPQTPREVLFVITDGIEDYISGNQRVLQPISPSECAAVKAKGVEIYVLNLQYVPLDQRPYYDAFYVEYVQPYVDPGGAETPYSPVATNLQACASQTGSVFYASSPELRQQLAAMVLAAQAPSLTLSQ